MCDIRPMKNFDEFHDGSLDGLLIEDGVVHLFLRTADKQKFDLKVSGLLSLKLDDFRQGNIIYEVVIRGGNELTLSDMSLYGFQDEAKAVAKLHESQHNGIVALEINPSYGGQCLLLAKSVELRVGWQTS